MNTTSSFSSFNRSEAITGMTQKTYDLLIIGGGATGAGIALDAASRGLRTILIEKCDFACGTSSKSTKLIHGGLRYLKQLDIGLVHESGTEREIVNRLAPHLCLPQKMLLPLIEDGTFGKFSTSIGLWVYDLLAKVSTGDRRIMLTKEEALEIEPLLNASKLKGAGYYAEYRTDDARLTIEIIKKAAHLGADTINYVKATSFIYDDRHKIIGVNCIDELNNFPLTIRATKVVSAGGPWVDQLRQLNSPDAKEKLYLTKGVHIVLPHHRFPLRQPVYFDVPDGRMIFAIPRGRITYVGTTDTEYTGHLDRVVSTEADRDYLLRAVNNMFPTTNISRYDIISSWAGLRALVREKGKLPAEVSRKDEIFKSNDGLISIAGGKLTGYRKMAERVVDLVMKQLCKENNIPFIKTNTAEIPLTSQPLLDNAHVQHYITEIQLRCLQLGLEEEDGYYLVTNYGRQTEHILEGMDLETYESVQTSLAISELKFCLDHEMVQRASDFFVRRTGRLYFNIQSIAETRPVLMAEFSRQLNWSSARLESEQLELDILIKDATHFYEDENVLPESLRFEATES